MRINQHFGRSERFFIYRVEADGRAVLLEEREARRPCGNGSHEEDALEAAAAALSDCSIALVSRIGPGADRALLRRGVKAFETPGELIPDAIDKLVRYLIRLRGIAPRG
ncbi:NifB/NifX family molybdenum-iron cluster-binding protein [Gorillibacterium massiliense]|uniref:NifB/NifX family molybdenum-iron cluster-binding protein n=1 Tax=Gorillibacterium massiliense TaxID=1280390 RepID=UPI00138E03A1|nr:NifB/NifX family molybdenum-iron cluster-binding protein [Gorillibacterium massiliense]